METTDPLPSGDPQSEVDPQTRVDPQPQPEPDPQPGMDPRQEAEPQPEVNPQPEDPAEEEPQQQQESVEQDMVEEADDSQGQGGQTGSIKCPQPPKSMSSLCREWNRTARIGYTSETARGWLKKMRDLWEIRHYQRCQQFLMQLQPFQHLVRDIVDGLQPEGGLHWQANSIFTLQTATEAYMCGFFTDCNLCALHKKVITINCKDVWLAIQIRGRDHVGGKGQVSDVGASNVSEHLIADPTNNKEVDQCVATRKSMTGLQTCMRKWLLNQW